MKNNPFNFSYESICEVIKNHKIQQDNETSSDVTDK